MKMFKTKWWNSSVVPNLFRLRHHQKQATHISCIKHRCNIRHAACVDFISQLREKKLLGPTACAVLDEETKSVHARLFSPGMCNSVAEHEAQVVKELKRLPSMSKVYPSNQWDEWLGKLRVSARRLSYQVGTCYALALAWCVYIMRVFPDNKYCKWYQEMTSTVPLRFVECYGQALAGLRPPYTL